MTPPELPPPLPPPRQPDSQHVQKGPLHSLSVVQRNNDVYKRKGRRFVTLGKPGQKRGAGDKQPTNVARAIT